MSTESERWPSLSRGVAPVQLDWPGAVAGRRLGKATAVAAWAREMRRAGFRVVEIGAARSGRALTWSTVDDTLPSPPPRGDGKSLPLDPAFVEARRSAEADPASTFARPRFRPRRPKGPMGSIRPA